MSKRKLYLMVGAPGSGKSTFIHNNKKDGDIVISRDAVRFEYLKPGEKYFSHEKEVFIDFINRINHALRTTNCDIWIDATHTDEKGRNKVLDKLDQNKLNELDIIPVFINTSLKECINRDSVRSGYKYVGEEAITSFFDRIVPPTNKEKYFYNYIWEVKDNDFSNQ